MARLVCYLVRRPGNTKGPSQKKALLAFLVRSYSVSLLRAKVPTSLPLPAEKTACTEKVSLLPHPGANEIGTSIERVDEGAIGPTGSGIGRRTLALQPWLPVLGTIVKVFSSVCVAAELPPLVSVTCHRRRFAGPALRVTAALRSGVPTIGATVMLSSPGANPPALGLPNEIVLTPAWSCTGMTRGCGSLKVLPLRSSSIGVPLLTVEKKVRGPWVA